MTRSLLLFASALLLLTAGCRTPDEVDCRPTTLVPNVTSSRDTLLSRFTRRYGAAVQRFSVRLRRDSTVQTSQGPQLQVRYLTLTTAGGAVLTLRAAAFTLPDGSQALGAAEVRVREIYRVPDMLLSNVPTNVAVSNQPLVSGGEFAIQVFQGRTRLRYTASATLRSPIPVLADTANQRIYNRPRFSGRPDSVGWELNSTKATVYPQVQTSYFSSLPLDSLTWWNIDKLWTTSIPASTGSVLLSVELPVAAASRVFLRPAGINGVIPMYQPNPASPTWIAGLPAGADVLVVVMQSDGKQLFYGTQRFIAQANLLLKPTLTPLAEADIARLIRQL